MSSGHLVDAGHVYLQCSNCSAVLCDIYRVRPNEPEVYRLKALCPFCGDSSYEVEVQGGFYWGGYGKPNPDNPEDDYPSTVADPPEEDDKGVLVIRCHKAAENAKPVTRLPR